LLLFPSYFFLFRDLLPINFKLSGIALALIAGGLSALGVLILYLLLRVAPASVVIPISALYPLVTVILSFIFLNEVLSWARVLGVACALAAIWLLSI
jgi:bacterial/archaeal transporter family protein